MPSRVARVRAASTPSRARGCTTRAPPIAPRDAGATATAVAVGGHPHVSRSRLPGVRTHREPAGAIAAIDHAGWRANPPSPPHSTRLTWTWTLTGIDLTHDREALVRAREVERVVALGNLVSGLTHELRN